VVQEPDTTWYFATQDAEAQQEWVEAIKAVMAVAEDFTFAGKLLKLNEGKNRWREKFVVTDPSSQRVMLTRKRGHEIRDMMYIKDIIICEALPRVQFPTGDSGGQGGRVGGCMRC
jgi:hypothetical protein